MKTKVWFPDSKAPPHPKLPRKLDKRYNLTLEQIEEIKEKYKEGERSRVLARIYGVSKTTILNYVNPELREKSNERARLRNQRRWRNDKEWRENKRELNLKSIKRKKTLMPEFRIMLHQYEYRRRARRRNEAKIKTPIK